VHCNSVVAELFRRGSTLTEMSRDKQNEQIGSAKVQPNVWTKKDDMITATLPSVSAIMWRYTPKMVTSIQTDKVP
jgi:hypothetical protein